MSQMIQCDGCKRLMYSDSRSEKGDYCEVWVDRYTDSASQYHLCRDCHKAFMENILHRVWDEDEMQWVPDEGGVTFR